MSRPESRTFPLSLLLPDLPDAQDACVRRLTELTSQQAGVSLAHATGDGALCVHFDPSQVTLAEVQQRVKAAGGAPPHHTPQPAVVDSAAVPARNPEPVPPPSPSGSASGSSGGGAPGDTTGGSTGTAPGDSTGGAPGDSTGGGTRTTPIEDRRR